MFKLSRTLCKVLSNIAERLFKVMDILPMLLVWFHYFVAFLFVFMYIKFILNLGKIFFFSTPGEFCKVQIDNCNSNSCENGGTCVNYEDQFQCICPMGESMQIYSVFWAEQENAIEISKFYRRNIKIILKVVIYLNVCK